MAPTSLLVDLILDEEIIRHSKTLVNILCYEFSNWTITALCCTISDMEEIKKMIEELLARGWTIAALSDELAVSRDTVYRWRSGRNPPENPRLVALGLSRLMHRRRIPKRKRYTRKRNPSAPKD
jgi:AraC-like DNA-binding protein